MKSIAWFTVDFDSGSGGHRTIFQNFNYLAEKGYKCDLYVDDTTSTPEEIRKKIEDNYFPLNGEIFCTVKPTKTYDISIATFYSTAKYVYHSSSKHKLYFAQDYEPWFFPMCESKIEAENSYALGLKTITIGNWLSYRIASKFNTETSSFSFCADLKTYHPIDNIKKENAICCVFQPDKPRRCSNLVLQSAQLVKALRPETTIYLFGSEKKEIHNLEATHLGILKTDELNALYNRCSAGLCISSSNPSRIPFEMMAAGLPVVDLYRENNFYDLPSSSCLLSDATPESLASALIKIIDNNSLRKKMSDSGRKYMQKFPLDRGFKEFYHFISSLDCQTNSAKPKNKKIYNAPTVDRMSKFAQIPQSGKLKPPFITDFPPEPAEEKTEPKPVPLTAKIKYKLTHLLKP